MLLRSCYRNSHTALVYVVECENRSSIACRGHCDHSGAGLVIGLLFVANINTIADVLARIMGQEVFDPTIYYFQSIPTIVEPFTVSWIVAGAILIAVGASILPARRAAGLHPVEALRYE